MSPADLTRLVGSLVLLRPLVLADVAPLAAYRGHPDVLRYQSWEGYDEAQALVLVEAMTDSRPGIPGEWHQWAIEERTTGLLAGDFGLRTFDDGRQGEIGFTLAPGAQGRGLGTEAARLVLRAAFAELGFHRVVANIDPLNAPAAALLGRLEFRYEGRSRESVFVHGAWADDDHYALLASEWR
jgi:RimJ/RimL family protein N-acetyltransferase